MKEKKVIASILLEQFDDGSIGLMPTQNNPIWIREVLLRAYERTIVEINKEFEKRKIIPATNLPSNGNGKD